MKKILLLSFIIILVSAALFLGWLYWPQRPLKYPSVFGEESPPKKCSHSASQEEYAVYEAAIPYLYNRALKNMQRPDESVPFLIVLGFTMEDYEDRYPRRRRNSVYLDRTAVEEKLPDQLITDYKKRNQETLVLEDKLNINKKYHLMNKGEYEQIFLANPYGERVFFDKYPQSNGFLSFSRPGIYKDKAFIYGQMYSGSVASLGVFLILSKDKDQWVVAKEVSLWVS